jgi:hypothetical protein
MHVTDPLNKVTINTSRQSRIDFDVLSPCVSDASNHDCRLWPVVMQRGETTNQKNDYLQSLFLCGSDPDEHD